MSYLNASDHPELFVAHGFEEHLVDLGEVRLNYATADFLTRMGYGALLAAGSPTRLRAAGPLSPSTLRDSPRSSTPRWPNH